jgi:tRNA(fMet)-specific endonuclease VapC
MDGVLVDTDVFSYVLKKHTKAAAYERHLAGKLQSISFITVGELLTGAHNNGWSAGRIADLESAFRSVVIVPYDFEICRAYAKIYGLKNQDGSGRTIAANDRWIAACAIRHDVPLVTNNRKHFEGIPGLKLISEPP